MGGTFSADRAQDDECVCAIRRCLDLGVTHIDTAEMYGDGHAEELIGQAIAGRNRSELIIGTKALAHHLRPKELIAAAEASIARMGCEWIDLYMVHHPSDEVPIEETMRGMKELVRRGLARNIGVCNFTRQRLEAAQRVTREKIVCNQVHYSLCVREPESTGLLEYCQREDVLLVAWQPIDLGVYCQEDSGLLRDLSGKYGRSQVQLALAWIVNQPNVCAVAKTMSEAHLRENLAATEIRLDPSDIEALRAKYEKQQARSAVYPLR